MVELFGKRYYIDVDGITKKCQTGDTLKNEDGTEGLEINIFKYEIIKVCLERVLNEYEEVDEELGPLAEEGLSISFKIAFNTLIKYEILIEEDDE
jgi:hypothetical protein